MAQISYGTITITDTNDIERIYPVYCRGGESTAPALLPLTNWKENISEITTSGDYIWQRIVTKKSGINVTQNDYGDAVRLTGEDGDAALNITAVEVQYGSSANWSTSPSNWSANTPTYDNTKPYYWTRTRLKYENNTYSSWVTNKDYALTDAITKSVEANANAAMAESLAQSANENAHGAMSQAAETQYQTEALAAKVKNYWWDSTGAHIASGIVSSGQTVPANVAIDDPSSYGFNSLVGLSSITFGYNTIKALELDGATPALKFYKPSKTTQGALTMELTDSELKFYGSDVNNADATLSSTGLKLKKGGLEVGTVGSNGGLYISTIDKTGVTINGHTPGSSDPKWRAIIGSKFGVDSEGNLYASSAIISGTLTAGANSTIGPWTVTATSIYKGNATYGTSGTGNMYFGNSGLSISNVFKVSNTGELTITSGSIGNNVTIGGTAASTVLSNIDDAATKATNYITYIDSSGIWVTPSGSKPTNTSTGAGATGTRINADGLQIFKDGISVAEYGAITRVGYEDKTHLVIMDTSIQGISESGYSFFEISSNGGTSNYSLIKTLSSHVTNVSKTFDLSNIGTEWTTLANGQTFIIETIYYEVKNNTTKRYKTIKETYTKGNGTSTTNQTYSSYTQPSTITTKTGYPTLDNGYTFSYKQVCYMKSFDIEMPFYRFGTNVAESGGANSFVMGDSTVAGSNNQLAIGQYNVDDSQACLMIGWGYGENSRRNVFTVSRDGDVNIPTSASYKINGTALSASDVGAIALTNKYTRSAVGHLDWTDLTDGNAKVIAKSALAYWNGRYNGSGSNLTYCAAGTIIGTNSSLGITTFTPTSGSSYSGYDGCYYEKYGRIVHLHVGVSGLTANTDTVIYTLPTGYRPSSLIVAHGTGGSWSNLGYVDIRTSGEVHVRSQGTYCGADAFFMV